MRFNFSNYNCNAILMVLVCSCSNGPIFGSGADLFISSECQANKDSYSQLPVSYGESSLPANLLAGEPAVPSLSCVPLSATHPAGLAQPLGLLPVATQHRNTVHVAMATSGMSIY